MESPGKGDSISGLCWSLAGASLTPGSCRRCERTCRHPAHPILLHSAPAQPPSQGAGTHQAPRATFPAVGWSILLFPTGLPPGLGDGEPLRAVRMSPSSLQHMNVDPIFVHLNFCASFVPSLVLWSLPHGECALPLLAGIYLQAPVWQIAIEQLPLSFKSGYKKSLTRSNANREVF